MLNESHTLHSPTRETSESHGYHGYKIVSVMVTLPWFTVVSTMYEERHCLGKIRYFGADSLRFCI